MEKLVDVRLLMAAADVGRNWKVYREDFARFAKPYWEKKGGDSLVAHMMKKYVNNDDKSGRS